MSFLLEIVAEIGLGAALDASVHASTQRKYKTWQRALAFLFLLLCMLFYAFILFGLTSVSFISLQKGDLAAGITMLVLAVVVLIGIVAYIKRSLKAIQRKRRKLKI